MYRALVWTFVTLVVVLALLAAKPYALAPVYPALFAGGVPGPRLARGSSRLSLGVHVERCCS